MYLVYIIKSNNYTYVGMTNNFFRRWKQHNRIIKGVAKYTSKGSNWYTICIIDGFKNKKEAMQCEWKLKSKRSKLSRSFKGDIGRIKYLNVLLNGNQWTSKSPLIKEQFLTIYIDNEFKDYIKTSYKVRELYWK